MDMLTCRPPRLLRARTLIARTSCPTPQGKARVEKMVTAFEGVSHMIIDEMSMIGRRSLGQVDTLLQKACGNQELLEVQT